MKRHLFGLLLFFEAAFLALALGTSVFYGEDDMEAFALTTGATVLSGGALMLWGRKGRRSILTKGDAYIIVALTWAIFSVFGCMPFILYRGLELDVASAYFETMSGFSTTGASVINDIDALPHGILLWRSLMQWIGGLGIVVLSFALLPAAGMKNANIYQAEATGIALDRLKPKLGATARRLLIIYLGLTLACAGLLWAGAIDLIAPLNHAMATLATGGFSTHQASIGYFHSAYVEYVCCLFMFIASVNFSLYYYMTIARPKVLLRNEELRWFLYFVAGSVLIFIALFLWQQPHETLKPFRTALFHVLSIVSSTGFQGEHFDYVLWGPQFWMPTVMLMAVGSCAGSTAGGIKVIRMIIYVKTVAHEFLLHLHPHAVRELRISGQVVEGAKVRRALAFIIMYAMLVVVGMFAFTLMGIDADSALGACISSLSNIGPGTGIFGPADGFAACPATGKWLLSFYMLVGRLELFTVLFVLMPKAWRR